MSRQLLVKHASDILKIRLANLYLNDQLLDGKFNNLPLHLAVGHEALHQAIALAKRGCDDVVVTHRNFGLNFAIDPEILPMILKYSDGNDSVAREIDSYGSMNLINKRQGIKYASSILGNNLSVASGLGYSKKLNGEGIVFVMSGDGAIEEGAFWEFLVFSRALEIPFCLIVENNDHSLSSTISQRRGPINLQSLASAVDAEYEFFGKDSFDDLATYLKRYSLDRAEAVDRRGVLVEVEVKTFCNHAGATPGWESDEKRLTSRIDGVVSECFSDPVFCIYEEVGTENYSRLISDVRVSLNV